MIASDMRLTMASDILRDYWLVSSFLVLAASAAILGDECDWTGR